MKKGSQTLGLAGLLLLAMSGSAVAAEPLGASRLSDSELDALRGGLNLNGLQMNLSMQSFVKINDEVALHSVLSVQDLLSKHGLESMRWGDIDSTLINSDGFFTTIQNRQDGQLLQFSRMVDIELSRTAGLLNARSLLESSVIDIMRH